MTLHCVHVSYLILSYSCEVLSIRSSPRYTSKNGRQPFLGDQNTSEYSKWQQTVGWIILTIGLCNTCSWGCLSEAGNHFIKTIRL